MSSSRSSAPALRLPEPLVPPLPGPPLTACVYERSTFRVLRSTFYVKAMNVLVPIMQDSQPPSPPSFPRKRGSSVFDLFNAERRTQNVFLFHRYALRQVPRLVHIRPEVICHVVRHELKGHYRKDRLELVDRFGDHEHGV